MNDRVTGGGQTAEAIAYHIDNIEHFIGKEIGLTDWMLIDQDRVNMFADATNDHNPFHTDAEWAKESSPYGGAIAHGFLTLSLLSAFSYESELRPKGIAYGINYGFERVRFGAPVVVGGRIRCRTVLLAADHKGRGRYLFRSNNIVEIESNPRPALRAEWLAIFVQE